MFVFASNDFDRGRNRTPLADCEKVHSSSYRSYKNQIMKRSAAISSFSSRHYRICGTQCVLIHDTFQPPLPEPSCLCEERRMRRGNLMLHRTRRSGILPRPSEDQSYPVISSCARNLFLLLSLPRHYRICVKKIACLSVKIFQLSI